MAYKNNNISPPLLISLLLLFATTNPPAHAQIPGGLIISGKLCCTGTGTCPGPPVSGALVSLNCSSPLLGASVDVLGQNITDINGFFNITIPNVLNAVSLLPCNVVVRLPLDQTVCAVLSTANGLLIATVQSVGTLLTQALGLVQNAKVSAFLRFSI
ncbi:hypothetical protein ACS0TY_004547 [Phlomoides rotata]